LKNSQANSDAALFFPLIRVGPVISESRFFSKRIAMNKAAHSVRPENTNNL
jgi:hypothetical protein